MPWRVLFWFVTATWVVEALVFDPASARPFIGPKLAVLIAAGAPAIPFAVWGLVGLARRQVVAASIVVAHVALLGLATLFSLSPMVSFAGDYPRGMGLVSRLAMIALAIIAGSAIAREPSRARTLLGFVLGTCCVVSVYAIVQAAGVDPIIDPSWLEQISRAGVTERRIVATLGHANFAGAFLVFGIGAGVALSVSASHTRTKWLSALGTLLVLAGIAVAGSRAAWVAVAVQTAALLPAVRAMRKADTAPRVGGLAVAAGLVVAAGAALLVALSPLGSQIAQRADAFRSDEMTGSSRTLIWRDATPMAGRYLLHGCGPQAFALAFLPYVSDALERAEPYALYDSAHNVLLDQAIETGLGGLASWIALVALAFGAIVGGVRARPDRSAEFVGLGIGLVGYLTAAQFVFDTPATALTFCVFVAAAIGLRFADDEPVESNGDSPGWTAVVAIVLAVVACATAWPRVRLVLIADRQMLGALALSASGKFEESVALGRAAVENGERDTRSPEMDHLLARILARAGDPARAPTLAEADYLREAEYRLELSLAYSTTPQLVFAELADLRVRFGDTAGAIRWLQKSVAAAPKFWPAHLRLAEVLETSGDVERARIEAERALDLNPESASARKLVERLGGGAAR